MRKTKRIVAAAAAVGMALLLTGCPDSGNTNLAYDMDNYAEGSIDSASVDSMASGGAGYSSLEKTSLKTAESSAPEIESSDAEYGSDAAGESGGTEAADEGQKYIRTIDILMELESEDEYNSIFSGIKNKTLECGGMITDNSRDFDEIYFYASMTLKVPKDKADSFLDSLEGTHKFKSISDNTEDVTLHYADVSARLKAKEEQRKKYMEYLDKAENTTELMEIEKELNDVIADIESYQSEMNSLNGRIDYTTINIKFSFKEPTANEIGFAEIFAESVQKILSRSAGRV